MAVNSIGKDFSSIDLDDKSKQERDARGRFTATGEEVDNTDQPTEKPFRKVIELGDGLNPQTFEADTAEELIEKMAESVRNGSLKIKEQDQKLKSRPVTAPAAPKKLTDDELMDLANELAIKPDEAFKKLFENEIGMSLDSFRSDVEAMRTYKFEKAVHTAFNKFMSATPDFVASKANADRLEQYMLKMGSDMTDSDNIAAAYQDLLSSGFLDTKKPDETNLNGESQEQRQKVVTGLKSRSGPSTPTTPQSPGPGTLSPVEMQKLRTMSPEEKRAFFNNKLRSQK